MCTMCVLGCVKLYEFWAVKSIYILPSLPWVFKHKKLFYIHRCNKPPFRCIAILHHISFITVTFCLYWLDLFLKYQSFAAILWNPFFWIQSKIACGLPTWFSGKESACQYRRHGFNPWVEKIPWRRKWQPPLVFLLEKPHG